MINKNSKTILIGIGIGLLLILVAGFTLPKNDVVASVNGHTISKEDLYNKMVEQYGAQSLDTLITNKVIELEAKKNHIAITEEDMETELQALLTSYGGEDLFNEALKTSGVTIDRVKDDIELYLITEKMLEPRIKITDEQIRTYFNENKELFNKSEEVKASHILVKNESTANEVREKLLAGEDFASLAKEYSKDSSNAEDGGDLGYFGKGVMAAEFEKVAFSLKVDEISDPVKTEYGYHIIKIVDKQEAKEATFDEHKEDIKETLYNQTLSSEYTVWLEEILAKYEINDYLN